MASSSHKTHNDYDYSCPLAEGEEDRNWLELGLGLGISRIGTTTTTCRKQEHNIEKSNYIVSGSAASSSLVHCQAHQQIGHSLGLELGLGIVGFDNNGGSGGIRKEKEVAPTNYNKSSMWQDNQGQEGHDYNLDLTAGSSSPSWPWHRISSSSTSCLEGKKPVSNDSHNCSSPLPPPPPPPPPSSLIITTTRPHSAGLWFTLSSSFNREGEALPQIPKTYIRVKDENVTVFMVKKYLVRKLGLSSEAEIEISCMGQKLMHTQTLKQVRDSVWLPGLVDSVNSSSVPFETSLIDGSILHELMSLQYYVPCRFLC